MEKYNYEEAIINDLKDWIINETDILETNMSYEELYDWIYDETFNISYITGNSDKYYDTEEKCAEYLCYNINLLYEAAREYCLDDNINILIKEYENKSLARYFDCTIRCYLLGECIYEVLKELGVKDE